MNSSKTYRTWIVGLGLCLALTAPAAWAEGDGTGRDWPQFRGPNVDGVSAEAGWNSDWSNSKPKVVWQADVGTGASTVSVVDGRLFTMGNNENYDAVWCFDAKTGRRLWRQSYRCDRLPRQFEGGPAATPTVDGDRVFTLSHEGHLIAWQTEDGKRVWAKHLVEDFNGRRPQWGYAGPPLVVGDKLVVDAGGRGASTLCLERDTGDLIWKSGNDRAGYAIPALATLGGKQVVLVFKADRLVAHDLADGRILWSHDWKTDWGVNAVPPIVMDDLLFISSGYNEGAALLKASATGVEQLWRTREMSNQMNGSVVHDGYAYGITGNAGRGSLMCISLADGEVKWDHSGVGTGSVMLADGKLIVVSERGGRVLVAPASPKGFKPTGELKGVLKGRSWVAPVLSHGRLYVKNNDGSLVCIDVSG